MIEAIIAGATLGLATWLHCVGMCGPLLAVFADSRGADTGLRIGMLAHHAGRVATYIVLGLIVGAAADVLRIIVVGSTVSIIVGSAMIIVAVTQLFGVHFRIPTLAADLLRRAGRRVSSSSFSIAGVRPFMRGIVNGLLPCGVSLSAIIASATIPNVPLRVLFLTSFGMATVPALFCVGMMLRRLTQAWQERVASAVTVVMLLIGMAVLVRGLALDLPYLSPALTVAQGSHVHSGCCGK